MGKLRWLSIPVVAIAVTAGVWVTGAVISDDETVAKGLTGGWFILGGVAAVLIGLRWRALAIPVIGSYVVVTGALGGFLLYSSTVDKVVDETVVVADDADPQKESGQHDAPSPQEGSSSTTDSPTGATESANVQVARGSFVDGAHPTSGVASLIDTASGVRVLTLTNFHTDPGPDLRVYVVPRGNDGVSGGFDLGGLKGNQGDQQYDVPSGAPTGQVVIWCRAFSVNFGTAQLR